MQVPASSLLVVTLMVAAGAAVTPVRAATPLTDVAYMQAARCAGLAEGSGLDVSQVNALLQKQDTGRMSFVYDKADELRSDARREARRADGYEKTRIASELSGACRAYLGGAQQSAAITGRQVAQ